MMTPGEFAAACAIIGGGVTSIITAPVAAYLGVLKERNRAAERARTLVLEEKKEDHTEDISVSDVLMKVLADERTRHDKLLSDERTRTEEVRAELQSAKAELTHSRDACQLATIEAAGCRRDSETLRAEVENLRKQLDAQRIDRKEFDVIIKQNQVLIDENTRLRTNLNAQRIVWESHLARERAEGKPIPLDLSMFLGLDDDDDSFDLPINPEILAGESSPAPKT